MSTGFVWIEMKEFLRGRKVIPDTSGLRWINRDWSLGEFLTDVEVMEYSDIVADYNVSRFRHEIDQVEVNYLRTLD